MIDAETLEKLQNASIEERIAVIEAILGSLKSDMKKVTSSQPDPDSTQRPAFGFMKNTGKILGDVVTPVLAEDTWEVLR